MSALFEIIPLPTQFTKLLHVYTTAIFLLAFFLFNKLRLWHVSSYASADQYIALTLQQLFFATQFMTCK